MDEDRPIAQARKLGEDPLRLADGVAEQHRRSPVSLVVLPPRQDLGDDGFGRVPAIDRQPERGLGDERVAGDRLEWRARRVGGALVVSGDDPDAGGAFDADLCRSEDVSGWMKGHANVAERERHAVWQSLDVDVRSESTFEERPRRLGAQVRLTAGPRVVAMDVRDERTIGRTPGIDVEAAGRAEKTRGALDQHPSYLARRALMNSQTTGSTEMKMMRMRDGREILLHDRDVTEHIAEAEARRDPEEGAGDVVEGERAVGHVAGAGDKRHERPHDGHEARDDDRLAAVLLEEGVRLLQVLAVEQPVQATALVVRREHFRPERAADAVVDGVADDRRGDERRRHDPGVEQSGAAQGARGEEQRIAGQDRRDHQAGFGEDNEEDDPVHPGAVGLGQRKEALVDLQDEIYRRMHQDIVTQAPSRSSAGAPG